MVLFPLRKQSVRFLLGRVVCSIVWLVYSAVPVGVETCKTGGLVPRMGISRDVTRSFTYY